MLTDLSAVYFIWVIIFFSQYPWQVVDIITPILQVKKMRLGEKTYSSSYANKEGESAFESRFS